MATAQVSPTANLLRKSRLFALPRSVAFQGSLSKNNTESNTATLPHPTRAAIVTPASSLAKGDWGLKRPLPAKSTTNKNSRPVVRINAIDTFEHVTDFDSAADHTVTLEKFQDLHLPISLPAKVTYGGKITPTHKSPFDAHVDNTETSEVPNEAEAQRFRLTGPWLPGMTEVEFGAYLKKVQQDKPELLRKLREDFVAKRTAEKRKHAQDNGEDLENLPPVMVTEKEFQNYVKTLRADPFLLGPVLFELLNIPSSPDMPSSQVGQRNFYVGPVSNLSSSEYPVTGPPKTHPSAGLSYMRSHTLIDNHPRYGPQASQRPVEARVLRTKNKRLRNKSKAVIGIAGIAVDETQVGSFSEHLIPPGLPQFDSTIPGGARYHVTPRRAFITADGRIKLTHERASSSAMTAHGVKDYKKPEPKTTSPAGMRPQQRGGVPRLDMPRKSEQRVPLEQPGQNTEAVASSLLKTLNAKDKSL